MHAVNSTPTNMTESWQQIEYTNSPRQHRDTQAGGRALLLLTCVRSWRCVISPHRLDHGVVCHGLQMCRLLGLRDCGAVLVDPLHHAL